MTRLVTKTVMVNRVNPDTGAAFNPPRLESKEVQTFDLDYGKRRRERQAKEREARLRAWQAKTPKQQLEELNRRIPDGAKKQKARIMAKIEAMKQQQPAKTETVIVHGSAKPKQKAKDRNKRNH